METLVPTVDGDIAGLPIEHLKNLIQDCSLWAETKGNSVTVCCYLGYRMRTVNYQEGYVNRIRQELITLVRMMLEAQLGITEYQENPDSLLEVVCIDETSANLIANRINGMNPNGSDMFSIFEGGELKVANKNRSKKVTVSGIPVPACWNKGVPPDETARRAHNLRQTKRLVGAMNAFGSIISEGNCTPETGGMNITCQSVADAQEVVRRILYYSQWRFIKELMRKC